MSRQSRAQLPMLQDLTGTDWLDAIAEFVSTQGVFKTLGASHFAARIVHEPVLIVGFETVRDAQTNAAHGVPTAQEIAHANGWSSLSLLAQNHSWFRDRNVYDYFDQLIDDEFFDDFDQVVFYGAGMGGYAAAAYSVAAPGSTVIAISPQATLDPRDAEWDPRFTRMRATSFTDRFGFAPDMLEAAARAFVFYDPEQEYDAMHAALFRRPNIARLRCRGFGTPLDRVLREMDILVPLLYAAGRGKLTDNMTHRFLRNRQSHQNYLRNLYRRLEDDGRDALAIKLCRSVGNSLDDPSFFRQRLAVLEDRDSDGDHI